jgi:hypothetical protein
MAKAKADAQCYLVESSDSEESIVTEAMSEPEWTSLIPEDKKIVGAKAKSMCKRKFQGEPGPGSYNITIKTNLKSPHRSRMTKIAPTSTVRPSTKSRSQPQTTWWNYNHVKNQEDDTPWWNYNHVKNQDEDDTPWWNYNHVKNQDDDKTWWNYNHGKNQDDDKTWWNYNHGKNQDDETWWNNNYHVKNQDDETWWNDNHVKNQDDDKPWWNYNHGKNQDDETWWNDNHVKSQEPLNDDVHMEDVFS